jgi:hypothetical protein
MVPRVALYGLLMDDTGNRLGSLVGAVLEGVWRRCAPRMHISSKDLTRIAPLLLSSGCGALSWRRIRDTDLGSSPVGFSLQQAYRIHAVEVGVHHLRIQQAFTFLRAQGIEPVLGKGWAIARSYPQEGLRPYGDLDLYVPPEKRRAAEAALNGQDAPAANVDLHSGSVELDDRSIADLYKRSQLFPLGEVDVRVLGQEDHFRLLCLHTLRHGAWRPLWLCDLAVALETRSVDFDWDYFLSGDRRRSDWVACSIGLAHQILGAEVEGTPVAERAKRLPRWLVPTVLRQWGAGQTAHGNRTPMAAYLQHPAGLLKALRLRWPNPIEATVGVRGPFNEAPRLPFQIGDALRRAAGFLAQAPGSLRQQHRVRA